MSMEFFRVLVLLGCLTLGYLLGSIPNSVIICKVFYHVDPRKLGSHNPGGTNVGRVVSKKAGLITIILDMLKLMIPFIGTFLFFTYFEPARDFMLGENYDYNAFGQGNTLAELTYYLVALGAMIGHSYSCFIKFKGGKIVSTYAGLSLALTWLSFPIFGSCFFLTLKKTKMVSAASIVTSVLIAVFGRTNYVIYLIFGRTIAGYFMFTEYGPHCCIYLPILCTFACVFLIFRHKENIKRIRNGTENKIHWMK